MSGMRRPVAVIIGMMGAGKTRVGKEVAQMMKLPFADADNEIEHDAGMRIPEYFEKYGEPEFRRLESDVVLDMLEDFDGIFSLGGVAPMTPSIQEGLPILRKPWSGQIAVEAVRCLMAMPMSVGRSSTRNVTRCSGAWRTCMWARVASLPKPRRES